MARPRRILQSTSGWSLQELEMVETAIAASSNDIMESSIVSLGQKRQTRAASRLAAATLAAAGETSVNPSLTSQETDIYSNSAGSNKDDSVPSTCPDSPLSSAPSDISDWDLDELDLSEAHRVSLKRLKTSADRAAIKTVSLPRRHPSRSIQYQTPIRNAARRSLSAPYSAVRSSGRIRRAPARYSTGFIQYSSDDFSDGSPQSCSVSESSEENSDSPDQEATNHELANESKPAARGYPLVWANRRVDLCESLQYYKSHQGAAYHLQGVAYGFMFNSYGTARESIDDNVIFARAAGGLTAHRGKMIRTADQTKGAHIRAVEHNICKRRAVAIILGQKASRAPARLPHTYNVLGWFKPTHAWAEKENGFLIWRYRFEKLDPTEESWWGVKGQPQGILGQDESPYHQQCPCCGQDFQQVYTVGWLCLNEKCANWWKLPNKREPKDEELSFDPRFKNQYTNWANSTPPQELKPAPLTADRKGGGTSRDAWRGLVCPLCGKCNARIRWAGWECTNKNCPYGSHTIPFEVFSAAKFNKEVVESTDWFHESVKVETRKIGNYLVNIIDIPGTDGGQIVHLIANKACNEISRGPDDMFRELQQSDIPLERMQLKGQLIEGGSICRQFAFNVGYPYKFIAIAKTMPFEDAPQAVRDVRTLLNWAVKAAFPQAPHTDFNESLVLGYFEDQRIDYHDDGEHGLGPSIASLSLGETGTMMLRMKRNYYYGVTKGGSYIDQAPIPGCHMYDERLEAHAELERFKSTSSMTGPKSALGVRLKSLPEDFGLSYKSKYADAIVKLQLGHGDIVIMHGALIQKYYEHSVSHEGNRRFAVTCRDIDKSHLSKEEQPTYEVGPDEGSFDGLKFGRIESRGSSQSQGPITPNEDVGHENAVPKLVGGEIATETVHDPSARLSGPGAARDVLPWASDQMDIDTI